MQGEREIILIFTDTDKTLGIMGGGDDEVQAEMRLKQVDAQCEELVKQGWVPVPDWFPIPLPGYEYKFPGSYWAYMKPKPKLRHVLKYNRFHNWRRRRQMKQDMRKFKDFL